MAEASKDQTAPLEKGRLLIADDDPEIREIPALLCEKIRHLPTTVESGEAALEMVRAQDLDVVILDIVMPVVAGVTGTHKFTCDLWGGTVHIASRMESPGHPSAIRVSETTERLLRDKFLFGTRGRIQVKGQGELMTCQLGGQLG